MKTHRGFLMVWALAGITVILILVGSVALTLSQAMRREVRMEIATDEALIVDHTSIFSMKLYFIKSGICAAHEL